MDSTTPPLLTDTFGNVGSWQTFAQSGLVASDFSNLYQSYYLLPGGGPAHPDFSSSGGVIEFGYFTANNSTGGGFTTYSGIDNWTVDIAPPAGVPEPGTLALLGTGMLGLLARRRRNR